jgi:ABC-type multidrug transport system fused ATPase/permease subunit
MKQMIKDVVEIYNEDKKEFITGILGGVLIFGFMIFVYWFIGMFMYDMV